MAGNRGVLEKCEKKRLEDGMKLLGLEDMGGIRAQHKGEVLTMHTRRNITFSVKGEKEVLMGIDVDLKCKLEH